MDTKVNKPVPLRSSSSTGIADTYTVSKFMGNAMGETCATDLRGRTAVQLGEGKARKGGLTKAGIG